MTGFVPVALGAACLLLCSCDAPVAVDPAANLTGNAAVTNQPAIPQGGPDRDRHRDDLAGSADQESSMTEPRPATNPPAVRPPSPRPQPEARPAPLVRPDEVDPPHRDPGDEVPL